MKSVSTETSTASKPIILMRKLGEWDWSVDPKS